MTKIFDRPLCKKHADKEITELNEGSEETTWTEPMKAELANLYHLARTALAGSSPVGERGKDTPYDRRVWASNEYEKAHPEVSSTAAYKELERQSAWRYL